MFQSPSAPPESTDVNPLRKLWWGLGILAVVLLLLYLFLPRGRGGPARTKTSAKTEWDDARCDRVLADAHRSLAPDRLGISSAEETILRDLNQWVERCGTKNAIAIPTDGLDKLLSPEALKATSSDRFLIRDARHVRTAQLCQQIAQRLSQGLSSDTERAGAIFEYVVRQVQLRSSVFTDPPAFTPFECLLYGEGTAAERAWLFVELLRQLPLDAVVFRSEAAGGDGALLVGVLSPGLGCLLFDPALGLPIPSDVMTDAGLLFSTPAIWTDATTRDDVFRQLDVDGQKHPWSAEALKSAEVLLVGSSSWWSSRMANLQFQLQPIARLFLSEPLTAPTNDQPGYRDRVLKFMDGTFAKSAVTVWTLPEEHGTTASDAPPNAYLAVLQRVFSGPTVIQVQTVNDERQEAQGLSNRPLKLMRVWQLQEQEETLRGYLAIRNAPASIPTVENNAAAQFATYWVGLSQFEAGSHASAQETLATYLQVNAAALRGEAAVQLIAESLMIDKQAEAVAVLGRIQNSVQPHRNAILERHWKRLLGIEDAAPQSSTAPDTK